MRLYEQAEIFRAELEQRLADVEQAQKSFDKYKQAGDYPKYPLSCRALGSERGERCRKAKRCGLTPSLL